MEEMSRSDRAAEAGLINVSEKPQWLCRVREAMESRKGTTHELKVEILNDDGTPYLNSKGEPTLMPKWVPKKECFFKEAFFQAFLPHIIEKGGRWDYDDILNKYALANMVEEDVDPKFGGGKRAAIQTFDPIPEAQRKAIEQMSSALEGQAPAPRPAPKPTAKPTGQAPKPAPAKSDAPQAAKPATAAPKPAPKPATAAAASKPADNEDAPFG
jgi:hypothetical protein